MEDKTEECKHCRTSEEEIYWKHFTSIHFFLTLPSHFHHHLELPLKFSAHMKAQVPDRVSLKGPSGASWDIEVLKYDDLIFAGKEWKDFVKVNCLNENCLLVFKYVRNSTFEVLIFDQESYCEKESTYFVKNCKHTMSDQADQEKKVVKDAHCTEIIGKNGEEETSLVASKRLRLDDEAEVCSEKKENAETSRKGVLAAASKNGRKPTKRKAQSTKRPNIDEKTKDVSHTMQRNLEKDELYKSQTLFETSLNGSDVGACFCEKVNAPSPQKGVISEASKHGGKPRKRKARSKKKSIINEKDKTVSQISQRNVSTPDNGESYLKKDNPNMSKALLKKSLNEEDYMITLESAEDTPASNESQRLKSQSDKQPSWNVTASDPCQVSEMNLILNENEDNCWALYSHNLEAQSDKSLSGTDTSNEPRLITPENGEDIPFLFCSRKTNVQADYNSSESHGKKGPGRPKKEVLSKSSKELVSKSASDRKKSSTKVVSNRRPVTETEKANALQRAKEKQTEDSFTLVMRRMSLYPKYFLHMPAKCLHKHPLQDNQEVVLCLGENMWRTWYRFYGSNYHGLTAGWKSFVLDNMLEESDVLVFKPVSQKDEAAFAMHVDIFRVV